MKTVKIEDLNMNNIQLILTHEWTDRILKKLDIIVTKIDYVFVSFQYFTKSNIQAP